MDDELAFFALLIAVIASFAVLAAVASARTDRHGGRRQWGVPAVSVALAALPLLAGVAFLLVPL